MESEPSFTPPGWPTVIPRLTVAEPELCVTFIKEVFGAVGDYRKDRPSELHIGSSLIMVGNIVEREPSACFLYVYVADTDQAHSKAVSLGATSLEQPREMPYGDRRAMIEDPWGTRWQIATHRQFQAG